MNRCAGLLLPFADAAVRGCNHCWEGIAITQSKGIPGPLQPGHAEDSGEDPDCLDSEIALVQIVRGMRHLRRVGREQLGTAFPEPALDILLEVYYRESCGAITTAEALLEPGHVPASVAERWLRHLGNEGFLTSKAHPTDQKIRFVELTDSGRQALERFFSEVRATALQQGEIKRPF